MMGMLDGLLGSIMGGMGGSTGSGGQPQSPLLAIALQMLQQNGGIEGILGKFQQAGFGEQADSWVSTGQNMPIDPGALGQIFGQGELGQIARQTGMSHDEVSGGLADLLPGLIDKMTPQGQVPAESSDLVNQALAMLQKGRMG
jgi:uncharacterized protein YidB (DUF937 family)